MTQNGHLFLTLLRKVDIYRPYKEESRRRKFDTIAYMKTKVTEWNKNNPHNDQV